MKCSKEMMLLYAVTDRAWTGRQTLMEQVEDALKGGATCVQLREKELDEETFLQEAMEMKALCEKYQVPFFVNDNVEIAVKCKADGIHVGQEDMAAAKVRQQVGDEMMIGVSVHSVEEALEAVKNGADCLGVGAMFSTSTKTDADVLPKEVLKEICDAVDIPVVAIGGISKENMAELKGTGVDGVALVSAIFAAEDIAEIIPFLNGRTGAEFADFKPMAEATCKMVTDSIDAYVKQDLELAKAVSEHDDIVDEAFARMKDMLIKMISENKADGEYAVDLLMIAKYFERIGDHAVNIAEWVIFSITGQREGVE